MRWPFYDWRKRRIFNNDIFPHIIADVWNARNNARVPPSVVKVLCYTSFGPVVLFFHAIRDDIPYAFPIALKAIHIVKQCLLEVLVHMRKRHLPVCFHVSRIICGTINEVTALLVSHLVDGTADCLRRLYPCKRIAPLFVFLIKDAS